MKLFDFESNLWYSRTFFWGGPMADLIDGLGGPAGFGENSISPLTGAEIIDLEAIFGGPLRVGEATFFSAYASGYGFELYEDIQQFTGRYVSVAPMLFEFLNTTQTGGAPSPGGASTGSGRVWVDVDAQAGSVTLTWDDVQSSSSQDAQNAYQVRLVGKGNGDFDIEIRYESVAYVDGFFGFGLPGFAISTGIDGADETIEQGAVFGQPDDLAQFVGSDGAAGFLRFTVRDGLIAPDFEQDDLPPLVFADGSFESDLGTLVIDPLTDSLANADGFDAGTLRILQGPSVGSAEVLPDGTISVTAGTREEISASFFFDQILVEVTASDGQTSRGIVYLEYPFVANDDAAAAIAAEETAIAVAANDGDGYFGQTIEIVDGPDNGTLRQGPGGVVYYTADSGFSGTDTFSYRYFDVFNGFESKSTFADVTIDVSDALPNDGLIDGLGGDAGFGERTLSGSGPQFGLQTLFGNTLRYGDQILTQLFVTNELSRVSLYGDASVNRGVFASPLDQSHARFGGSDNVPSPGGTSTGSNRVYMDVDGDTVTLTWDDVSAGGFNFPSSDDISNAYQIQIIDRSDAAGRSLGDFDVVFRYEWVGWTSDDGPYGFVVADDDVAGRAGLFENESGAALLDIPGSGTDAGLRAVPFTAGADGVTGVFVREIRNAPNLPPNAEDDALSALVGTERIVDVLANDGDPEGNLDPLSLRIVSGPRQGVARVVSVPDDAGTKPAIVYSSVASASGTDTITYEVADALGETATAEVTITLISPPAPQGDQTVVRRDGSVLIDVFDNDVSGTLPIDPATLALDPRFEARFGEVTIEDRFLRYDPDPGFTGFDSFRYTVRDTEGNEAGAFVQARVIVPNVAPDAADDTAVSVHGAPVRFIVTNNDTDPDSAIDYNSVQIVSGPSNGTVYVGNYGVLVYTPESGFAGTDQIRYSVADFEGATDEALVTITVQAPNQAPRVTDDAVAVEIGDRIEIDVLGNDVDPDGTIVAESLVLFSQEGLGTFTKGADGIVTFVPDSLGVGTTTIRYGVRDEDGAQAEGQIAVDVSDPFAATRGTRIDLAAGEDVRGAIDTVRLSDETIAAVWMSREDTTTVIRAQVIDAGDQLASAPVTLGEGEAPSLAVVGDGSIFAVWASQGGAGPVRARRLDADGQPGEIFDIPGSDGGRLPTVASVENGFAVAWSDATGIHMASTSSQGSTGEAPVTILEDPSAAGIRLAELANGTLVAVWEAPDGQTDDDIKALILSADGTPLGPVLTVNQRTANIQSAPEVTADAGGFTVAWESYGGAEAHFSATARSFDLIGAPLGDEVSLSSGRFRLDDYRHRDLNILQGSDGRPEIAYRTPDGVLVETAGAGGWASTTRLDTGEFLRGQSTVRLDTDTYVTVFLEGADLGAAVFTRGRQTVLTDTELDTSGIATTTRAVEETQASPEDEAGSQAVLTIDGVISGINTGDSAAQSAGIQDNRARLGDLLDQPPFTSLVQIKPDFFLSLEALGSGSVIAPNVVLTASHVLDRQIQLAKYVSLPVLEIDISLQRDGVFSSEKKVTTGTDGIRDFLDFQTSKLRQDDIAVVRYDEPIAPASQAASLAVYLDKADLVGVPFIQAGYPGDFGGNRAVVSSGEVLASSIELTGEAPGVVQDLLVTSGIVNSGQSGGPLYSNVEGVNAIIGVASAKSTPTETTGPGLLLATYFNVGTYTQIQSIIQSETSAEDLDALPRNVIVGSDTPDQFTGTFRDELITGKGGNDSFDGGGGKDEISGGEGDDFLAGGLGDDLIDGGPGSDALSGGDGDDTINGGDGDDVISGWSGDDTIDGGEGAADIVVFAGNCNEYDISGGNGSVTITHARGSMIDGTDTLSNVEYLRFFDGLVYVGGGEDPLGATEATGPDAPPDGEPGGDPAPEGEEEPVDACELLAGQYMEDLQRAFGASQRSGDPIIVDLDGDGVSLIPIEESTVQFDLTADGRNERVAWFTPGNAVLARDLNADGVINDITEFFGSDRFDGFTDLADFDDNRDGYIDADDAVFAELLLWDDANSNGVTDAGELRSVAERGFVEIDVEARPGDYVLEGNRVSDVSTFAAADGTQFEALDVWFQFDPILTSVDFDSAIRDDIVLDPEALILPKLRGYSGVDDLTIAMSSDGELKGLLKALAQTPPETPSDLLVATEAVLFRWIGVEELDSESRGGVFDARKLAALEAFLGTGWQRREETDPDAGRAENFLGDAWEDLLDAASLRLAVQTKALPGAEHLFFDHAGDRVLIKSADAFFDALSAGAPEQLSERAVYWEQLGGLLGELMLLRVGSTIFRNEFNIARRESLQTEATSLRAAPAPGLDVIGTAEDDVIAGLSDGALGRGGPGRDTYLIAPGFGSLLVDERDDAETILQLVGDVSFEALEVRRNGNSIDLWIGDDGIVRLISAELAPSTRLLFASGESVTVESLLGLPNGRPEANDDVISTFEDASADTTTAQLLSNDRDPEGEMLAISNLSDPANGLVELLSNGNLRYIPNPNFFGSDSFGYTVSDGNGGTDTATVTVTVTGVNDDPVAGDDSDATDEDKPVDIDVLGDDEDVDGDTLTVSAVDAAANGTTAINPDGTIRYTPNTGFDGADSFSYTVSDGNGGTDTATVTVTVSAAPNQLPVVSAITAGFGEDQTGRTVKLLDPAFVSDPDGDDLDVENVTVTTANGRVLSATTDPETGLFSFDDGQFEDLAAGVPVDLTIDYDVTDGIASVANSATVTITGANDDPVGGNDGGVGFETDEDSAFTTASVLGNDTDVDGDTLSVVGLVTNGTLGLVTDNGDGSFDYDPNGTFDALAEGETATDTFVYFISDGVETVRGEVTITITGKDDSAPDINLISGTPGRDILRGTDKADRFIFKGGIGDVAVGNSGDDIFDFIENVANGAMDNTRIVDWSDGDMILGFEFDDIHLETVRSTSQSLRFAYGPEEDVVTITGDVSVGLSSLFDIAVA